MERRKFIKTEKSDGMKNMRKIKMERDTYVKIEKGDRKKNMERDQYVKIEVLNDLELKEESKTGYIKQLEREIRCLKHANRNAEFGTVIWKKNYKEMESRVMMLNKAVTYEKELEIYRLKNSGLLALVEEKKRECVGLEEKLNDLSSRKDAVDSELNGLKIECAELKERVTQLEEGNRLLCEKEKKGQEEILRLSIVKDKCEQLQRKNRELELEKNSLEKDLTVQMSRKDAVDNELNGLKIECTELKERVAQLEEGNRLLCEMEKNAREKYLCLSDVKDKCEKLQRKNNELELEKRRLVKEINDKMIVQKNLTVQNSTLKEQQALVCEREKVALNRITNLCEEIQNLEREKQDLIRTNIADMNCLEDNGENSNRNNSEEIHSEPINISEDVQHEAPVNLDSEALSKGDKNNPIDIDDIIIISDTEDDLQSNTRFERPLSGQRCVERLISCKKELSLCSTPKKKWDVEIGTLISCKKELQLSSTPKRKWVADTGTSEVRTEDEVKMKKLNAWKNVLLERFSMKMQTPSVSSQSRSIEENKGQDKRVSHGECMRLSHFLMNVPLHEKVGNTTFMGEKENVVKEVSLNGKGEHLGGYIPESNSHLAFNHVMVICQKEQKCRSLVDFHSSLKEDPELCLKAFCALCRQQALKEQLKQDSLDHSTRRGFSPFDELRGTELGNFLMDGNLAGELKKSVEELKLFDSRALDDCKTLAEKHSSQIFNIYQAKEDPFFTA